jgi:hypothetical protein
MGATLLIRISFFARGLRERAIVSTQNPIILGDLNASQPDIELDLSTLL